MSVKLWLDLFVVHIRAGEAMNEPQRFVILAHDHPVLHWDLMLDTGETLRTWRLESAPVPDTRIPATSLPAHRRMYLDYEGPVSGNRGTVARWDSGTYLLLEETPFHVKLRVNSCRMQGLVEMADECGSDEWMFVFHEVKGQKSLGM